MKSHPNQDVLSRRDYRTVGTATLKAIDLCWDNAKSQAVMPDARPKNR
jgi:hypothetical protein